MTDPPLNLALTGCGRIACDVHIPVLRRLRGVQLIAVADPRDEALQASCRLAPGWRTSLLQFR